MRSNGCSGRPVLWPPGRSRCPPLLRTTSSKIVRSSNRHSRPLSSDAFTDDEAKRANAAAAAAAAVPAAPAKAEPPSSAQAGGAADKVFLPLLLLDILSVFTLTTGGEHCCLVKQRPAAGQSSAGLLQDLRLGIGRHEAPGSATTGEAEELHGHVRAGVTPVRRVRYYFNHSMSSW